MNTRGVGAGVSRPKWSKVTERRKPQCVTCIGEYNAKRITLGQIKPARYRRVLGGVESALCDVHTQRQKVTDEQVARGAHGSVVGRRAW